MNEFIYALKKEFTDLYKFRWVTYSFVSSNLKMRYKRSIIGVFWSMLGPALNYLIMGLVFSVLARNQIPHYFAYLFSGAALFNLINTTINNSINVFIGNESYIKKIYLPKSIFVLNLILMETINFLFSIFTLLILGIIFNQYEMNLYWLFLPVVLVLVVLFLFGISSLIGVATVYFRDVSHLLPLIMQACFFGTPILYSMDSVPEKFRFLIKLNPIYYFVESFRSPIINGELTTTENILLITLLALITFLSGVIVLKHFDNKIIFKL